MENTTRIQNFLNPPLPARTSVSYSSYNISEYTNYVSYVVC